MANGERQILGRVAIAAAAVIVAGTSAANAANESATWNGTASTINTATGWSGGIIPNGTGIGTFNATGAANSTVTVDTNRSMRVLFDGNNAYTLTGGSLNTGGGGVLIGMNATTTANQTVNSDLYFGSATTTATSIVLMNNFSTTNSLTLGGNIGGQNSITGLVNALQITNAGSIVMNGNISNTLPGKTDNGGLFNIQKFGGATGAGNLTLNGNNSYSGGTDYFAGSGSFTLGHKNALGTGALRVNGSGVTISANTNLTGANAIANTIRLNGQLSNVAGTTDVTGITAGLNTATVSSATNLAVGQILNYESVMRNFPIGTYITSISGNNITLSNNALTTANISSGSARFRSYGGGSGTHTIAGSSDIEFSGTIYLGSRFADAGTSTQNFNVTNTGSTIFSGTLAEEASIETGSVVGALRKTGAGTLTVSGSNTYSGGTVVDAGTLLVNNITGSGTGSGAVNVNAGTLGGNGFITGAVNVGNSGTDVPFDATLSPGNSIDSIDTGALTFAGDGRYLVELNAGTVTNDITNVTGGVTLGAGVADLSVTIAGTLADGQKYFIISNDASDAVSGTFAGLLQDAIVTTMGSVDLKISYVGDLAGGTVTSGNDVVLYAVAVPEPTTLALAGLALLGLKRRRA